MNFVYDINFVFAYGRGILYVFLKFADLVDAVIACGVHFDYIDVVASAESFAYFAFAARRAVHGRKTVHGSREYFCGTRFARSARPREKVSVPDVAGLDLIDKRPDDMFLTDYVAESIGTVSAVKRSVSHGKDYKRKGGVLQDVCAHGRAQKTRLKQRSPESGAAAAESNAAGKRRICGNIAR